jgi:hypothetical protein
MKIMLNGNNKSKNVSTLITRIYPLILIDPWILWTLLTVTLMECNRDPNGTRHCTFFTSRFDFFKTGFHNATGIVLLIFVQCTDLYLYEISHSGGLINTNYLTFTTFFCKKKLRITHQIRHTSPLDTTMYPDVNTARNYECTTVCDWEKSWIRRIFRTGVKGEEAGG